jgi:hypothetical protein
MSTKRIGQVVTVTIQRHDPKSMAVTFVDENNVVQHGRMYRKQSGFTPQELFDLTTKRVIPERFEVGKSFEAKISMYGYDEYKYWLEKN